jgi:hypothetical protein
LSRSDHCKIKCRTEVVRVSDAYGCDTASFCAADSFVRGLRREYLSHGVMAINDGEAARVYHKLRLRFRIAHTSL